MNLKINASIVALAALVVAPLTAMAATPFAGEDFDGGSTNGGFTAATQVLTPDLSGSVTPGAFDASVNCGAGFPGACYDRWGVVSRGDNLPYDFTDNSADTFAIDSMGILDTTKTDNVVILADTKNDDNPGGTVSATWTFDISGKSNLEMGIDFAMIGDFEADDNYSFSYSIDGGASTTVFDIQIDENEGDFGLAASSIYYGVNMETGGFFDRYYTPFFESADWDDLLAFGEEPGVLEFHPRDDGTNGDTAAQDGLVPITSLGGTIEERAYNITNGNGNFDEVEIVAYKDPLFVNPTNAPDASGNNFDSGTQLTDDFQTITVPVSGTGTTLTLEFTAFTNSDQEALIFDSILLSEGDAGLAGDYNGNGTVDAADYTVWRDGNSPDSSIVGYNLWVSNFGTSAPPATTVPEPTTLLLVTLAAGLGFARRR